MRVLLVLGCTWMTVSARPQVRCPAHGNPPRLRNTAAMGIGGIVYKTLRPLDADYRTPPSDFSDQSEPYVVFRNQISLSSLCSPSTDSAAPDYFSLDVKDGGGESNSPAPSSTPSRAKGSAASTPPCEPYRTLESGWFKGRGHLKSPMLRLHKEILDFCDFLSPTPEEQASRNTAIERVFDVIRYIWPNCKVEIFGSFKTGLYLPTSDIDVVILGSNIKTPQMGLVALSRALSQRSIAMNVQVIGKARVPIVKFLEKKSGVAFDISFDMDNGPKAAQYIKNAISRWPPLRPLCLILKIFLQQRELNQVYLGGVGSYALLVMLMAMLRSIHECQSFPENNLGVLLVIFFEFYGCKLNTYDVGVSCDGTCTFFTKSSRGFSTKGRPLLISIQDPQVVDNDIGKSSFNYFQVKSAFNTAYSTLTNARTILGLGSDRSILGTIIRPDAVLLKRSGGSDGDVTFNSLLPGAGEPLVQQQPYGRHGILCNWRLDGVLPRGHWRLDVAEDEGLPRERSPRKKRKAKDKHSKAAVKENGEEAVKAEKRGRRRRKRQNGSGDGGFGPRGGGSRTWTRSSE